MSAGTVSRRDFFRASAAGGFSLGGLLGLGMDLRAARAEVRSLKIANAKKVPSVWPLVRSGTEFARRVSATFKKVSRGVPGIFIVDPALDIKVLASELAPIEGASFPNENRDQFRYLPIG